MEEYIDNLIDEILEEYIDVPTDEVLEEPIKVYIKVNVNNEIIEVGSSVFIKDFTGWIKIDEGFGDKYAHAQSQYFDKPLINEDGTYNYSYMNGQIIGG